MASLTAVDTPPRARFAPEGGSPISSIQGKASLNTSLDDPFRLKEYGSGNSLTLPTGAVATVAGYQNRPSSPASSTHDHSPKAWLQRLFGMETSTVKATPSRLAEGPPEGAPHPEHLRKETADREAELQSLRQEVRRRQTESARLREKIQDAELALKQASMVVGTVSAKVDAASGSRHALLEATALRQDSHANSMRQRLARLEVELAAKDDEVLTLHRAVAYGSARLAQQGDQVRYYRALEEELQDEVDRHEEDLVRLRRYHQLGQYHNDLKRQMVDEHGGTEHGMRRVLAQDELQASEHKLSDLENFIRQMEVNCAKYTALIEEKKRRLYDLAREDRMLNSAVELGSTHAQEQVQNHMLEKRSLETRIAAARSRKAEGGGRARAYDHAEEQLKWQEARLVELVELMREGSRVLQDPSAGRNHGGLLAEGTLTVSWGSDALHAPGLAVPLRMGSSPFRERAVRLACF